MPHFGLMNPSFQPYREAALQRARLHIRGGRRRLRQGKVSAGLVTLYDALLNAMEWRYLGILESRPPTLQEGESPENDRHLFRILRREGHIDGRFDYETFSSLVYRILEADLPSDYSYSELLQGVESVMEQLGVIPFDEGALPREDPATF